MENLKVANKVIGERREENRDSRSYHTHIFINPLFLRQCSHTHGNLGTGRKAEWLRCYLSGSFFQQGHHSRRGGCLVRNADSVQSF